MNAAFAILDGRAESDRRRWIDLWTSWPGREVQAHPAYLELFAASTDRVLAAVFESSAGRVLYPFVQRPVPPDLGDARATDLTSPYGYGGPFAWNVTGDVASSFWREFDAWAKATGVVSEFIRFAVGTSDLLDYPGERIERLQNVIVPTETPPATLWTSYAHKVRKNVNKARAAGIKIVADPDATQLSEFLRIYDTTMSRRGALASYRFGEAFFRQIANTLPGQFMYFHALSGDRVVSTELALVSADRIYSYLGGTDEEFFDLRPNDLLKHEMIAWAHDHGKRQFVLGGGYTPGDGIFKYKESFAPGSVVPFYTGQRILDSEAYQKLATARAANVGGELAAGFFPAFRAPLAT